MSPAEVLSQPARVLQVGPASASSADDPHAVVLTGRTLWAAWAQRGCAKLCTRPGLQPFLPLLGSI